MAHHEAEVCPLIEKIPVDIDAVRFRQVIGNQLSYLRQVFCFLLSFVLGIMYAWGSRLHILTHGKRCAGVLKLCQIIFTIGENDLLQANSRSCPFVEHVTGRSAALPSAFSYKTLSLVDDNLKNTKNIVQIYFMLNNLYKQRGCLAACLFYRCPQKRRFAMQCLYPIINVPTTSHSHSRSQI